MFIVYYMFILLLWVDLIETAISASTTASTTDCDFIPHGDSTVSTFFSIFQSTICRHMKKNIGDLVVDLRKNQHQQKIQCTLSNNNNITEQGTSEFSTKAAAKMQQKKPFIIIYLFYYMFIICLFVYFIIKSRLNWDCNKYINNCINARLWFDSTQLQKKPRIEVEHLLYPKKQETNEFSTKGAAKMQQKKTKTVYELTNKADIKSHREKP